MNRSTLSATIALVALLVGLLAVHRASPGPADQEIVGVAIGGHTSERGIALVSGRRLACTPGSPTYGEAGAVCRVSLAGRLLEIEAIRNEPPNFDQLNGRCRASYGGVPQPCRFGNPTQHTHFFAYLPDALGLDRKEVWTLRWRYPIENLDEGFWKASLLAVPGTSAVLAGALAGVWLARVQCRRSVSAIAGMTTAVVAFALSGLGWLFLTGGFWD